MWSCEHTFAQGNIDTTLLASVHLLSQKENSNSLISLFCMNYLNWSERFPIVHQNDVELQSRYLSQTQLSSCMIILTDFFFYNNMQMLNKPTLSVTNKHIYTRSIFMNLIAYVYAHPWCVGGFGCSQLHNIFFIGIFISYFNLHALEGRHRQNVHIFFCFHPIFILTFRLVFV